jgi:hypothetical protein
MAGRWIMSERAKQLADRLRSFNNEVIAFVENCTEEDWRKVSQSEDWSVGVVARHIGAGHYNAVEFAKMIVRGEKLPELKMDDIIKMANQHASEHADCTKAEVAGILRESVKNVTDFISGLGDEDLDRKGYLSLFGNDVSVHQFIETVILSSGAEHLANMKAAATGR